MFRTASLCVLLTVCAVGPATAVPVDPDNPDGIAALFFLTDTGQPFILRTDGLVYTFQYTPWEWTRHDHFDAPIPVSEIYDWTPPFLIDQSGNWWWLPPVGHLTWGIVSLPPWLPISVRDDGPTRPATLAQNHPNPFNPSTTISFDMPLSGQVQLIVNNVRGELITILVDGFMAPGHYEITWDGHDDQGQEMPSGVYFYRIESGETTTTGKMTLVR